ncbi:phosphatidylinositol 3,4,5-trisphosphate 3-phosphatase and protein-tyrosine-phosphatase PTEN1 isoform X3 [Malania oleifera]|uniref:phosphatidylinositol 3,4,5-trisphosphate 3-phosphatase and protein-tyrosine-phosphatase PTEN1 isoform X3 n=1 Tax=Malania oleifera TaxID=397392 RepID=UPI0025AE11C5|nr:phosphatidylinositol 3,4,5-trisphosphate 3-phosphatase and protein-tyrosine-phosphatase PTEN1 isoform X3 [Malania oleifera]
MGLKFSKQGLEKDGKFTLAHAQHHLINYLTKSFRIRNLVSKQRRRMLIGGYDLDMTYITERVLAMSFPAERMRAMYRNPLWQVRSVLDTRHPGHYKVYNLCIEETYDPSHFHGRVESFPFDDNHVPPLHMIKLFCQSVDSWLSRDPKNIAVIHCMAGKGRTGLMVCAYLVYSGMTAEAALQLYAQKRTTNNEGVSIPSQRRYVGYWADVLSFPRGVSKGPPNVNFPQSCNRELRRIRLYDTVNTDSVFCVVTELQQVTGDVRVIFYQKMIGGRLFYACFNTSFIKNSLLQFSVWDLDKVGSKGKSICGPAFCLELLFGPANGKIPTASSI